MSSYRLSSKADADIKGIAQESIKKWGRVIAEKYMLGLHAMFQRLVEFPDIGVDASHIRPGYMRIVNARHSVFYKKAENGILIVRVLHEHMDFDRHFNS